MRLKFRWSLLVLVLLSALWHPVTATSEGSNPANRAGQCSPDMFACRTPFSSDGMRCISKNWMCDGDDDCPDRDDEENCENPKVCPDSHFKCPSTHSPAGGIQCIALGWQCDGKKDCQDGADEDPELCRSRKKGHHSRGDQVDQFQCLPNMYRCPGTYHCINFTSLCDGIVDCSADVADEGGHCLNKACRSGAASKCQLCKETMQGPQCYCMPGRVYNESTSLCDEMDECRYDAFCDQDCEGAGHGYTCSCLRNYTHVVSPGKTSKSRCYIDPALPAPMFLLASHNKIQLVDFNKGHPLTTVNYQDSMVVPAVDFDYTNGSVCWVLLNGPLTCADAKDPNKTWTIDTQFSLDFIKQVAKDWISGNWYFADEVREQIFVCTPDGKHCKSIIHIGISKPKSVALDPTRGYLFYTDWSASSRIGRADLDGSNGIKDLVSKKIVHPHGLTLDLAKRQLYWGDAFLDFIERIDYDGLNRVTIAYGLNVLNVFSMSLLENYLYVINHYNHSIVKIHRYDHIQPVQQVASTADNPNVIKIIHQVRQPNLIEDSDICGQKKCSHFCIPVPSGTSVAAKCVCRTGYHLVDETQCKPQTASSYLLYTNAQQGMIRSVSMDTDIGDVQEPIINLVRPMALAVDPRNNKVYYSDINTRRIAVYDPNTGNTTTLKPGGSGAPLCEGLAVDWVGNNLYWTDSAFRCIFVASLDNLNYFQKLICTNLTYPKSIALDPIGGRMYWTDWVMQPSHNKAKIESARMDGTDRRKLTDTQVQWPNSLCLDVEGQRLYWTEAFFDRIQSMTFDGTDFKVEVNLTHLSHPHGIVYDNGTLYWTEVIKGEIRSWTESSGNATILRQDSTPLFDLVKVNSTLVKPEENHQCSGQNNPCSDLCLPIGQNKAVCICALNRLLSKDNHTCSGDLKLLHCPDGHFTCVSDGSCVTMSQTCNGHYDCADGSDEDPSACVNFACGIGEHRCEGTKQCILLHSVCDGESDCLHGTDEDPALCKNRTCPANYTRCGNSSNCILDVWQCDGEDDCPDGSDEGDHCEYKQCTFGQFTCVSNKRCLPMEYRCDHEYDCEDKSDEVGCDKRCDSTTEFKCKKNSVPACLPLKYVCDGTKDCQDGSDEHGCLVTQHGIVCSKSEFTCLSNLQCIPEAARCDRIVDCADESDEQDCPTLAPDGVKVNGTKCHWSEFMCHDGRRCIPRAWMCDRDTDCSDRSDEINCTFSQPCERPNFRCKNHSTICLPPEKLCNNVLDCPDSSDEGRACAFDTCLVNDCSDKCHKGPDGAVCSCFPNRHLDPADNKTCLDDDICQQWGACSQKCTPAAGGIKKCSCYPGYDLAPDKWTCKAQEPATVIFSCRHEIRQLSLKYMTTQSLVSGLRNTIALDFLWGDKEKYLFWTDVADDRIYRGTIMSNTVTDIRSIIDVGLATTEGLAVDWVGGNIYWVESNLDQIEVARLDGSNRTTLLAGNMQSPRAIVLDPRVGLLFWTDWKREDPRIERCSMSGENETRSIIYDIRKWPNGGWPNGLTLDYEVSRLYWVDARSDSVHSVTYKGGDHKLILSRPHEHMYHPFAMSLFEDSFYWTDWRFNSLVKANKFNGSNVTVIQSSYTQPFDVKIFHPLRQPAVANNPCRDPVANGGCSHLCLLGNDKGKLVARCRCPHRWKLMEDKKTCTGDNTFLLYVKEDEIRGVDLETGLYNVIPSITVPFVENASAIDYDIKSERIYWTDKKRRVITSAHLNGTGIQTIIDTGLSNPEGFAIDWLSGNMYFTSYDDRKASISVAKLDGAFRTVIVQHNTKSKLNSIAIHPKIGVMFWSEEGVNRHRIMRAYMDGTNETEFVSDTPNAASLTVNLEENRLYWVSRTQTPQVFSCLVSETGRCNATPVDTQGISHPHSIAFHGHSTYYASADKILKVNLGNPYELRQDTPRVSALQVYDPALRNGTNSCSEGNGGCQQLCLPHSSTHHCRCTVGFTLNADQKTCRGVTSFLLYSISTEIRGISLDPQSPMETLAPISQISLAASVNFYAREDRIYWVDMTARTISRINRDLSDRQTIVNTGISGIESLAVDWVAGNIYWTDRGHDVIQVSKLNGSDQFVIVHEDLDKPRSIAVHPTMGYLYVSDWGTYPRIIRTRLDGSNRTDIIVPPLITDSSSPQQRDLMIRAPYGLAVDLQQNVLYWCDKALDKIERVNLTSLERKVIINRNLTDCISLDVYGDHIYWADQTDLGGSIKRANKDGSNIVVLKSNISRLEDIKVFHSDRQTGTNMCAVNNGGCAELCLYQGNNSVTCACSHGKLAKDGKSCEEHDTFLLFSKVTSIESILIEGNATTLNAPVASIRPKEAYKMQNVIGLACDYDTKRIFFSDIQRGDIYSIYFNSTGYKRVYANVASVEGLAYDSKNHQLFFTSYSNSSINHLDLSPQSTVTNPHHTILVMLGKLDHPRAIVANPCMQRIFWTNWKNQQPCIQTSLYDGRQARSIVTDNIQAPNGLAIDYKARKLYWSDAGLDKIERINYDGSERMVIVQSIPQHSFSLAVHGDFLYWTDWQLRAVLRANKYDGSGIMKLRKEIDRQPMGIIVVDKESTNCEIDPCYKNAFGCDQLCSVDNKGKAHCSCNDSYRLLNDGKRCIDKRVTKNCSEGHFLCADRSDCISYSQTCNGAADCKDASDESKEYCATRMCDASFFLCKGMSQGFEYHLCLEEFRVCDGHMDCHDGTDEQGCPCEEDEFQCEDNGMCIRGELRCDHDSDCIDHSDEKNCTNFNCSDLEMSGVRQEGLVSCNTTSMCIYPSWICDHSNDCWDNNDEKNCNYTDEECLDGAFRCDDGTCIHQRWHCDKDHDCTDGSDERNCSYSCDTTQVKCHSDSVCIPATFQCDGHQDCSDGSDEKDCSNVKCQGDSYFNCSKGRCIPLDWVCDGVSDCLDGEDERLEAGCDPVQCTSNQFECRNRLCIPAASYCDGDNDCGDNSDEPNICVHCQHFEFRCPNSNLCVNTTLRCDGKFDCPDQSDELDCPCEQNKTMCAGGTCISNELVCNGYQDCEMGDDEPSNCNINECMRWNGGCSHTCIDEKIHYRCACPPGFQLKKDNMTCEDINECQTMYPCSQFCENHQGTFSCSCAEGYDLLLPDNVTCKAVTGPTPMLLVANRYYIRLVNMTTGFSQEINSNCTNAVAVDFDWQEQYMYWSDITSSASISRKSLDNSSAPTEKLHKTTISNPDGLAVDWVGRNLYWCDKTTDTIEVSRLNGSSRLVLVREGLQEPRGLEVFPQRGLLFYTDWGDTPHIGSVHMDGSLLKVIIQDNLAWPNALTIDYVTSTIFWADGNLDYIGMAHIDGSMRRTVVGTHNLVPHVFAITTFESHLYWTDWEKDSIMVADKFTGNHTRKLTSLAHNPMDIQVVHPLRQVPVLDVWGREPCDLGCSDLCLLRPHKDPKTGLDSVVGVCACPENFYLSRDGVSCISNCTTSQFQCHTESKCIPLWWECDGRVDCFDNSDEHDDCRPYHCPQPGMYQCEDDTNRCLFPYQICDGVHDCANSSDESQCASYRCLDNWFKCPGDNKCIPEMKMCDNTQDCSGNEDERDCANTTCSTNHFRCNNSRCVPYLYHCDKADDCGDNSDEPSNCRSLPCKSGYIKCRVSGRCILENWKCDGDLDCGDGDFSDEDQTECSSKTCDPTFFECTNGHCIPAKWKCDFYDDCKDGSDEYDCTLHNCSDSEFQCTNGRCVSKEVMCDGNDHCGDHSDEVNCNVTCQNFQFKCKDTNYCIPYVWKCDGDTDCSDGSDEWGCDRTCGPDEFRCANSVCQPLSWRCDGDSDCADNSDEDPDTCKSYECAPGQFRCKNHICIWDRMVCNGKQDCAEGEDEDVAMCPEKCVYPKFSCHGSSLCLPPSKVCDGIYDCGFANATDYTDEDQAFCNMTRGSDCEKGTTNNCQHYCHQYYYGTRCSCYPGYVLNDDGFSCDEVNPCDVLGTCAQYCHFDAQRQTHSCQCEEGFRQHREQCYLNVPAGESWPSLLIAGERKVEKGELKTDQAVFLQDSKVEKVSDLKEHIVAMDVDVELNTAFIVTHVNSSWHITKQILNTDTSTRHRRDNNRVEVISQSLTEIRGLAVDWIGKRLYVSDGAMGTVRVMDYTGKRGKRVVEGDVHSIQAIAVDSINSQLYWSDRGPSAAISRSNLDGSGHRVVVGGDMAWPNDLTVDPANGRVYWVDSKLHTVETATTNGGDRRVLWRFNDQPTSVDVFGNVLYIVTGTVVYQMTKYRPSVQPGVVYVANEPPQDIIITHKRKQKTGTSQCQLQPCPSGTQLCFNLPSNNRSCSCPDNAKLEDHKCQFKCPCLNGGTCLTTSTGNSKCKCREGYDGTKCETYACTNYCHNGGFCHITNNQPICICPPAFTGDRCDTPVLNDCDGKHFCQNGGTCVQESNGFYTCRCPPGFTGRRCQDCLDRKCFNGGVCSRRAWHSECLCPDGFHPASDCAESCADFCTQPFFNQEIYSGMGLCNCDCPPSYTSIDCQSPCKDYCKNNGVCKLVHGKSHPECQCPTKFFEGDRCQTCKCWPGGECVPNANKVVTKCTCHSNYTGDMCETLLTGQTATQSGMSVTETIILSACITVVFIIIGVILAVVYFRHKKRQEQYHHKRMQDGGELNVTNPVYMRKDPGDEDDDDDEEEPLGTSLIFTGDAATNFANPMYDVYNTNTSESTQMLLATGSEERELLDNNMSVRYFGSNEGADSQKFSVA